MKIDALKIILASGSPRRQHLLKSLDWDFEVRVSNIKEEIKPNERVEDYVVRNSLLKLNSVYDSIKDTDTLVDKTLIISADTVVSLDGVFHVFEKPKDKEDALYMLGLLSDHTHIVFTGVSLLYWLNKDCIKRSSFVVQTKVKMKKMSEQEKIDYVETLEPMDKAGAYAIQGIGAYLVEKIEGSHTNVIGLPLCELCEHIKELEDSSKDI